MTAKASVHPFLLRVLDWEPNQLAAILVRARRQVNARELVYGLIAFSVDWVVRPSRKKHPRQAQGMPFGACDP